MNLHTGMPASVEEEANLPLRLIFFLLLLSRKDFSDGVGAMMHT